MRTKLTTFRTGQFNVPSDTRQRQLPASTLHKLWHKPENSLKHDTLSADLYMFLEVLAQGKRCKVEIRLSSFIYLPSSKSLILSVDLSCRAKTAGVRRVYRSGRNCLKQFIAQNAYRFKFITPKIMNSKAIRFDCCLFLLTGIVLIEFNTLIKFQQNTYMVFQFFQVQVLS